MNAISCYITNNLSDLTFYEKRNNKEVSFNNLISPMFTVHVQKLKIICGLVFAYFEGSIWVLYIYWFPKNFLRT